MTGRQKINHYRQACLLIISMVPGMFLWGCAEPSTAPAPGLEGEEIAVKLPEPRYDSEVSLEESLLRRRSVRNYTGQPLTLQELSQLLWAAQGITDPAGLRTAPSAGALYPLEVYIVAGDVADLLPGVYRYEPEGHQIVKTMAADKREDLAGATWGQDYVKEAAADFVFAGVYERTTGKYGERGIRYVHLEAGHAAQNLCLQATALELGAVTIGAFDDDKVAGLLDLPEDEEPLYIIPIGRK